MERSSPLKLSKSSTGTWCVHLVTQSCPTLGDSMNCSLPPSSVLGIAQAKILEWIAIFSCRASSQLRSQIHIPLGSCIAGRFFITEPPMVCRSNMATPLLICPHFYCLPPPWICPRHTAFFAAFWIPQICFVLSLYSIFPSARNTFAQTFIPLFLPFFHRLISFTETSLLSGKIIDPSFFAWSLIPSITNACNVNNSVPAFDNIF